MLETPFRFQNQKRGGLEAGWRGTGGIRPETLKLLIDNM